MKYNVEQISAEVSKRRRRFVIELSFLLTLMVASFTLLLLNINDTLSFILIVLMLLLMHCTASMFARLSPAVLFRKEILGVNIQEDLYRVKNKSGPGLRHQESGSNVSVCAPPIAPNTGANKRISHSLRGTVYLQSEDGNVHAIRRLSKMHVEIYNDGDTLLKLEGTNYPIILNREDPRQPCPLCGAINGEDKDRCSGCGISISH